MYSRLLFNVLLVGLLVQFMGCGNPQQELWDKYDSSMENLGASSTNPSVSLVYAQSCLSTLQQIKKENPNATKPTEGDEGDDVDSLIKGMESVITTIKNLQKIEYGAEKFRQDLKGNSHLVGG